MTSLRRSRAPGLSSNSTRNSHWPLQVAKLAMKYAALLNSVFTTVASAISETHIVTIPCTATPLPNDCIANSWSNTIVHFTVTQGGASPRPRP
jgi:hypothetical protein